MEVQALAKRLDWLDEERRKDKQVIAQLQDRIVVLEGKLRAAEQENKTLVSEVTHLKTVLGRLDRIDDLLAEYRTEFSQWKVDENQRLARRDAEIKKLIRTELQGVEASLVEVQQSLKSALEMRERLEAREEESNRLINLISSLNQAVDELRLRTEDQSRAYRVIEDGRRQDSQRVNDLQGEVSALRKRADEFRGQFDVLEVEIRRLEGRLKELASLERELSEAQTSFINKLNEAEVEREKTWAQWARRFEQIETQASELEHYLQDIQQTSLEVRRTQEKAEELSKQVERRINELTEIQRLSEERFRQEWNTFKADDQKRWTNYMLSHDEQQSDTNRRIERLSESIALLEDTLQAVQDFLEENSELSNQRLQAVLAAFRDWAADYERLKNHLR